MAAKKKTAKKSTKKKVASKKKKVAKKKKTAKRKQFCQQSLLDKTKTKNPRLIGVFCIEILAYGDRDQAIAAA